MYNQDNTKNKRSFFFTSLFSSPEEKSAVLSAIIIAGIMSLIFLAIPRGTTLVPEEEAAAAAQQPQEENDVIFSKYVNDVEGCFSTATPPSNTLVCQERLSAALDRYCNNNIESFDQEKCTIIRSDSRVFELLMN